MPPSSAGPTRIRHESRRRLLQVIRTEDVTPHMRSIVLGGPELQGFVSAAADDHVKLFLPGPGEDRPNLAGENRPLSRDYTPRRYDAQAGELTIDFVLHGEGEGPASDWARQARPGQWIGIGGPRGSLMPPPHDHLLLAGDETALPAIARRLEELEQGAPATVLIEVADAREERPLPSAGEVTVRWLHRDGVAAGRSSRLSDAVRSIEIPPQGLYAWLAGEIEVIRGLRSFLVNERGVPRERIRAAGYWRLGEADAHGKIED